MIKVLICFISLALANYIVEGLHDVPNYEEAAKVSWTQLWALVIYHFIWEDNK